MVIVVVIAVAIGGGGVVGISSVGGLVGGVVVGVVGYGVSGVGIVVDDMQHIVLSYFRSSSTFYRP